MTKHAATTWRLTYQALWRTELQRFGPLPLRASEPGHARDRSLWQAEAYATIIDQANRERQAAALRARRHGATFEQIGAALGISRQAAAKLIQASTPPPLAGDGLMVDHKQR